MEKQEFKKYVKKLPVNLRLILAALVAKFLRLDCCWFQRYFVVASNLIGKWLRPNNGKPKFLYGTNLILGFFVVAISVDALGQNKGAQRNEGKLTYEFTAVCTGWAKETGIESRKPIQMAIAAFSKNEVRTIVIDRIDRDSQWIISSDENSPERNQQARIILDWDNVQIRWMRAHTSLFGGDRFESIWNGRITRATGATTMTFISKISDRLVGGTEFNGLCEQTRTKDHRQ